MSVTARIAGWFATARDRAGAEIAKQPDRGDVPGWVMVTVMTRASCHSSQIGMT